MTSFTFVLVPKNQKIEATLEKVQAISMYKNSDLNRDLGNIKILTEVMILCTFEMTIFDLEKKIFPRFLGKVKYLLTY